MSQAPIGWAGHRSLQSDRRTAHHRLHTTDYRPHPPNLNSGIVVTRVRHVPPFIHTSDHRSLVIQSSDRCATRQAPLLPKRHPSLPQSITYSRAQARIMRILALGC